jgi:hypothetical protein
MDTPAREGLPYQGVLAKRCLATETLAPVGASELTHWQWEAIDNGERGIMRQSSKHLPPQALFEPPQIGCLAREGRPAQRAQGREEVGVVASKVGEQRALLRQSQAFPPPLPSSPPRYPPRWVRAALAQSLAVQRGGYRLVNETKDGDNELVQVNGILLRSVATDPEEDAIDLDSFSLQNLHIGLTT